MSSTKRRDVRVSLRKEQKLSIQRFEDVKQFYAILYDMYQQIKTPLFPFEFLKHGVEGFLKLFVIKYNNSIVGGNLCVDFPTRFI